MTYLDIWRQQLKHNLATVAPLAKEDRRLNLIYGITAAAVLWGVRDAPFNNEQQSALKEACGDEKHLPHLLLAVEGWNAMIPLDAARSLTKRQRVNHELRVALTALMGTFIEELFAEKMVRHQHIDINGTVTGGNIVNRRADYRQCRRAPAALGYDRARPVRQWRWTMAMDVVDFEVRGSEMQFVEIELDPGEAAIGEAGSMMFMDAGIGMDTVFGDGSKSAGGGLLGKLLGAGKRLVTGESLFTTVYTNQPMGKQRVAFAAPYPGKILPMDLRQLGGTLICQKDAFLCAARGVSLGVHFQQKLSVGFFGGEGFIMEKLEGNRDRAGVDRRRHLQVRDAGAADGGPHAGQRRAARPGRSGTARAATS